MGMHAPVAPPLHAAAQIARRLLLAFGMANDSTHAFVNRAFFILNFFRCCTRASRCALGLAQERAACLSLSQTRMLNIFHAPSTSYRY